MSLDQLATWRQEADEELEAVRPDIIQRASAIADYIDTSAALLLLRWMITALLSRRSGSG